MVLYEGSGIGFLEANADGNDRISEVGRLESRDMVLPSPPWKLPSLAVP